MFCSKCGRQIPDGSVCPCQQPQQKPESKFQVKLNFSRIAVAAFAVITFIVHWFDWYSSTIVEKSFGPYMGNLFSDYDYTSFSLWNVSVFMGFAQILSVLCLILFPVVVFSLIFDTKKLLPFIGKSKIDIEKLIPVIWFALVGLTVTCGFLGTFSTSVHIIGYGSRECMIFPAAGLILTAIFSVGGLVLSLFPLMAKDFKANK